MVGIPSIIMVSIGSIMVFGMNKILISFTSTATAIFGVYYKLQSFVFMPVFGMNNGMVPIIAYNYGARKPHRIKKVLKLAIMYACLIMFIGFIIIQIAPTMLLGMFNPSENMIILGVPALRIISISFLLAGFAIISSSYFQALGHGIFSLLVSILRQLFVLLPAAYILSKLGGLDTVWWAFPIAEIMSASLSALFINRIYHKEIRPLELENK